MHCTHGCLPLLIKRYDNCNAHFYYPLTIWLSTIGLHLYATNCFRSLRNICIGFAKWETGKLPSEIGATVRLSSNHSQSSFFSIL